jgi:DNA-binding GntR family transcriptional regulator
MTSSNGRSQRGANPHGQLPDMVAGYIREQVMSGNLRPGEFLRMEPIAEALGVSMTPVREGLVALSGEGYVSPVPRRGFVVAAFTREDVRDLFWAQGRMAGELAARAAKRIGDSDLERLGTVMNGCDSAIEQVDSAAIGHLGHQFHRIINRAADSDRLAQILAGLVRHLPNQFYASIETHVQTAAPEHHAIYDALRNRDTRSARRITESHIVNSSDYVIEILEGRGLWDDVAPPS